MRYFPADRQPSTHAWLCAGTLRLTSQSKSSRSSSLCSALREEHLYIPSLTIRYTYTCYPASLYSVFQHTEIYILLAKYFSKRFPGQYLFNPLCVYMKVNSHLLTYVCLSVSQPCSYTHDQVVEMVEFLIENWPVRLYWEPAEVFHKLSCVQLLLQLISIACDWRTYYGR